ncbi:MAG: beta-phosphoglucomutase family hydrolase [Phycisphaeraceae bacterium]|nr:beta-phosphoglucomutase family hydrolase [Phycisphaeraceae bacterium]
MSIEAIIFDVDGVLVQTDRLHERSWRALAQREGLPFPDGLADRLRGVSRERSLELLLGDAHERCTPERRVALMDAKNQLFLEAANALTPDDTIPGVRPLLAALREMGLRLAAASASRNARLVLDRVGLSALLHAVIDGHDAPRAKPDPQCFLMAAEMLQTEPARCVVVEDALAGVDAAVNAGMAVVGVGPARQDPRSARWLADLLLPTLPGLAHELPDPWK